MKKRIYKPWNEQILLTDNEVHIWHYDLNKYSNQIEKFANILSSDELIRAGKFYFERDKNWFITSRGLLRIFVNIYSSIPAKEIKFIFNDFGKPSISVDGKNTHLHFNLSHSKNFMSVGFVNDAFIGIDVELMKPLKDHLDIAKRFFSVSEVKQLLSFPVEKILEGFYSCWTAKEAVIKLSGEGLYFPLKEFDVELQDLKPDESYRYKVNLKKRTENLSVEVYKLNETIYGACAVNNNNPEFIHCYFDDELAIPALIT